MLQRWTHAATIRVARNVAPCVRPLTGSIYDLVKKAHIIQSEQQLTLQQWGGIALFAHCELNYTKFSCESSINNNLSHSYPIIACN